MLLLAAISGVAVGVVVTTGGSSLALVLAASAPWRRAITAIEEANFILMVLCFILYHSDPMSRLKGFLGGSIRDRIASTIKFE
jgi:hypothetical protein